MKRLFVVFFLLVCWFVTGNAQAADNGRIKIITSEELKAIIDTSTAPHVIVDARNPQEYQEVHIKGAINVPVNTFDQYKHLLPHDKSVQVIFYCNGVKCGKSRKAAKKAAGEGYTNILVYADGMPVWEEKGYPLYAGPNYEKRVETTKLAPMELEARLKKDPKGITVVDVRDVSEFKEGHIPGAINIPSDRFASQSGVLDKKKQIVVYCNSGGRSYTAYRKLMKLGYKHIYQTLFFDWKEQGLPVEN